MAGRRERVAEGISFLNSRGFVLAGVIDLPRGAGPWPVVVFAHGWDSGKDSPRTLPLARRLTEAGMACLRLDLTGHGESGGTRDDSTTDQQSDDVTSAVRYLRGRREIAAGIVGVHGASLGAIAALRAAIALPQVRAVVLRGPRVDTVSGAAAVLAAALLVLQGEHDPLLASTKDFFSRVHSPKEMLVLSGAGHLLDDTPEAYAQAVEATVAWFVRYLLSGAHVGGDPE